MEHADFVVWMIFSPFFSSIGRTIEWKYGERREDDDTVQRMASILWVSIWGFVGYLLY